MAFNVSGLEPRTKFTAHWVADVVKDSLQTAGTYHIGPKQMPEYSMVVNGFIFVETAVAGGTSMSFGIMAAADLAAAIADGTLLINYKVLLTPVIATNTTWLLPLADLDLIVVTIGTHTAGRVHVWLDYVVIKP